MWWRGWAPVRWRRSCRIYDEPRRRDDRKIAHFKEKLEGLRDPPGGQDIDEVGLEAALTDGASLISESLAVEFEASVHTSVQEELEQELQALIDMANVAVSALTQGWTENDLDKLLSSLEALTVEAEERPRLVIATLVDMWRSWVGSMQTAAAAGTASQGELAAAQEGAAAAVAAIRNASGFDVYLD
ncbi:hypothetical protein Esti_004480 [Eimeria stiedai]